MEGLNLNSLTTLTFRLEAGVGLRGGRRLVLGGEEGWDGYHDTIESYDPATDSWTVVGDMPSSRSWLSSVALTIRKDLGKEKV